MSVGLFFCSEYFCADGSGQEGNSCTRSRPGQFFEKHALAFWLPEMAVGITAFVLGLLSALSVVAIPAAAGYAMIGVGAFILALDILVLVMGIRRYPTNICETIAKGAAKPT